MELCCQCRVFTQSYVVILLAITTSNLFHFLLLGSLLSFKNFNAQICLVFFVIAYSYMYHKDQSAAPWFITDIPWLAVVASIYGVIHTFHVT